MKITKREFLEKYGNVEVSFYDYYKYTFSYRGITEAGHDIKVEVGGNPDEIYRLSVSSNSLDTIATLDINSGAVYDINYNEIESF